MNPDDIIKAAPAIAKGAGALAAAIPFTAIVKRMLGPAADEVAEMWRDQIRLYRYERQLKCVEKAERMAQEAGFTPQAVPPKILFPLLEGASLEEAENLHDMWAALLANASMETAIVVRPRYMALRREMLTLMTMTRSGLPVLWAGLLTIGTALSMLVSFLAVKGSSMIIGEDGSFYPHYDGLHDVQMHISGFIRLLSNLGHAGVFEYNWYWLTRPF